MKSPTVHTISISEQESHLWENLFYILLAAVLMWRLCFAFISPLDLSPDESYYWDWSRHPEMGYYSKPPMIAWINLFSTGFFGSITGVVRLPSVFFGTLSLFFIFALTRRMFDEKTAFFAAALSMASPGNVALSYIMTIDAPLVFFWSLSLYLFYMAVEKNKPSLWIGLGVASGFGVLSKQMMLVFSVIMIIYLFLDKNKKPLLKNAWPYLSIVLSASFLAPVLYWNMKTDWITLKHTAHHFESHGQGGFYFLKTMGDFLGTQLGIITPVTWFLLAVLTVISVWHFRKLNGRCRYLYLFGSFSLFFFMAMSIRQRINANWPAVFYIAGIIFLSAWHSGYIDFMPRLRKWVKPGLIVGAVLTVLTYALVFAFDVFIPLSPKLDPTFRLKGWHEMGEAISGIMENEAASTFLIASNRENVSAMAFYVKGNPRVYKWTNATHFIDSQYDLWKGPHDRIGDNAILVQDKNEKPHPELVAAFKKMTFVKTIRVKAGLSGFREFDIYKGEKLINWPRN